MPSPRPSRPLRSNAEPETEARESDRGRTRPVLPRRRSSETEDRIFDFLHDVHAGRGDGRSPLSQLFEGLGLVGKQDPRGTHMPQHISDETTPPPAQSQPSEGDTAGLLQEALRRARGGDAAASQAGSVYDRARSFFARHETALREQATLAEQLIEQLRNQVAGRAADASRKAPERPPPADESLLQERLRVRAQVGTTAAGRFVLANRDATPRRIAIRADWPTTLPRDVLRIVPNPALLEAGAEIVVAVEVDLARLEAVAGDRLSFTLLADEDDGAAHRLDVEVDVYATGNAGGSFDHE